MNNGGGFPRVDFKSLIKEGDGVWWGQAAAEPQPLVTQLLDQADSIGHIRAFSGLSMNERLGSELPARFTVSSYGGLGRLRGLSRDGRLDVLPCHYSALPRLFARGFLPCDVGLLQVSPPDAHGFVSLGIGVDYVADAVAVTPVLIAEINHRMPATSGSPRIPLDRFAAVIETDRPLPQITARNPDAIDRAIGGYVAELVEDGDTIQIGVGTLPDSVLEALSGHRDLGVHSGMITDGVLDLVDKGVITGALKEIDRGLVITGAALCSEAGYARIPDLDAEFRPASYTHSPAVLSQLSTLTSINSAIEIDLLGQVGAEMFGGVFIGAVGGQVDFSRAASLTGARSIIAMRSNVRGQSTIVPTLRGGLVSTARTDVDVVVTEHGIARLTGCRESERARRLISIAAPEYRAALERSMSDSTT